MSHAIFKYMILGNLPQEGNLRRGRPDGAELHQGGLPRPGTTNGGSDSSRRGKELSRVFKVSETTIILIMQLRSLETL